MFKTISEYFYAKIDKRILWFFIILYIIIGFGLIPMKTFQMQEKYGEAATPFDLQFTGYDKSFADNFLSTLGDNGRREYVKFVGIYDTLYPITYGGLLLAVLTLLILSGKYRNNSTMRILNLLPFLIVIVDYAENACSIYNTTHFPNYSLTLLSIASVLTQIKWLLVVVVFVLIVFLGISKIIHKNSEKSV